MKVLLTTLNSKYTHSSLALRYLSRVLEGVEAELELREYTINNQLDYIVRDIYSGQFDAVVFSVYIWNVEDIVHIAKTLKQVAPHMKIVFGGPEVTFESERFLESHPYVDVIVRGEGEVSLVALVNSMIDGAPLDELKGLTYRLEDGDVVSTSDQPLIGNLDDVPFPYVDFSGLDHKILYYESSRGCPFNCQYCLSSTVKGVRFFSLDRVKRDLKRFIDEDVMQVKFIDRTFNADSRRSLEIFKYLAEVDNGRTNFHFEITADRLDEQTLEFLEGVRPGLFQFEIGVQSTHEPTLKEIRRFVDFEKLKSICTRLRGYRNIHLHLDLIAGLPYEGYDRFMQSFDDVYGIRPEMVQLGFLKLLKGSGLRNRKETYGYIYNEKPPYEIMATADLSFGELIRLKGVEDMVEHFYNSQKFTYTLEFILKVNGIRPSKFYEMLSDYWLSEGWQHKAHNQDALYEIMEAFYVAKHLDRPDVFREILRFDYVRQSPRRKLYADRATPELRQFAHAFLQDEANVERYLEAYKGQPAKQIVKKVRFEKFEADVLALINNGFDLNASEIYHETLVLFDYDMDSTVFESSKYYVI